MQLMDAFRYAFLMVTIKTCVQGAPLTRNLGNKQMTNLQRRETSLLLDNYPADAQSSHTKLIYRSASKSRHAHAPRNTSSRPYSPATKSTRRPTKKYGKPKFAAPKYRKATPRPKMISMYKTIVNRPLKNRQHVPIPSGYFSSVPAGFAEPSLELLQTPKQVVYPTPKPIVDSYGSPVKSTVQSYQTSTSEGYDVTMKNNMPLNYKNFNYEPFADSLHLNSNKDISYQDHSKRQFPYRDDKFFQSSEFGDVDIKSELDFYKYKIKEGNNFYRDYINHPKKLLTSNNKVMSSWKHPGSANKVFEDELVGGQYAEPPARYVPKLTFGSIYLGDNPKSKGLDDTVSGAANTSPYVNYKNSNVAFSPQNLNDVFSIVD